MIRNPFVLKTISITLVVLFFGEIIYPTTAMAMLTNGETQPDIYGYSSPENSENVGLSTGMFNYSIPITSIPEYPMGISYKSGSNQDDEAGVFGYGFSGFSGAIGRTVMGLPDDLNGGPKTYKFTNQVNWSASAGASIGTPGPIGVSAGLTVGYDNYLGCFMSTNIGLNVNIISNNFVSAGLGLGFGSDSRSDKVGFGGGFNLSTNIKGAGLLNAASNIAINASNMSNKKGVSVQTVFSLSDFKMTPPPISSTAIPPLANVSPTSVSWGLSLTVPLPPVSVTASYNQTDANDTKPFLGYGYMYSDRCNRTQEGYTQMSDFAVEGEDSYNGVNQSNPVYLQKDYFIANAMGISGNLQLYQNHYGLVSRNRARSQSRDIGLVGSNTNREEVYPWTGINQARFNKDLNILDLFKKKKTKDDPKKDLDNMLFYENQRATLDEEPYRFNGTTFRMKGDLAGQFNMVTDGVKDNSFLGLSYTPIANANNGKLGFITLESKMPLLKPLLSSTQLNANQFESSTQIRKYTTNDVTTKYGNTSGKYFDESFYMHYNPDGSKFNILESLKQLQITENNIKKNQYIADEIAWIDIKKADGMRYIFNLPVYANESQQFQISGKGDTPPGMSNDRSTYVTPGGHDRGKAEITNNYKYPYAWLLTAVVGADYVDNDNIPGPSDGDLGYWVKFKYIKVADNYVWRNPYAGLTHLPGAIETSENDSYAMQKGSKEIYVLSEIESADYITKYTYGDRADGYDAPNTIYNGKAINTRQLNASFANTGGGIGGHSQKCVTQIDLYKKHFQGNNSGSISKTDYPYGKRIQSTVFDYDYRICPQTPNSYPTVSNPYKAKLTLTRVQNIAYDENNNAIKLPSYKFSYWGDTNSKYNPDYDNGMKDRWGNFSSEAKKTGTNNGVNYYSNYCEYDERIADDNAKVYQLKSIRLPSGGMVDIDYKARSYGYVGNQTPYVMRRILPTNFPTNNIDNGRYTLYVDVSDIYCDLVNKGKIGDAPKGLGISSTYFNGYPGGRPIVQKGDELYGEIAFYQEPNNHIDLNPIESKLHIESGTAKVYSLGGITSVKVNGFTRYYQAITLYNDDSTIPFVTACAKYMYTSSIQMRAVKESLSPGCGNIQSVLTRYELMNQMKPLAAAQKMISNFRNLTRKSSDRESKFDGCFGAPGTNFFSGLSFIRTNIYKGKYTGTRVNKLTYTDNFSYGKDVANDKNSYGTVYYFDENSNGASRSAGVATIEPGGGKAAVIDLTSMKGIGYAPSPTIISSRTTVLPVYKNDKTAGISSRKKGKTVYEFYTPKDIGLGMRDTYGEQVVAQPANSKGHFYMLMTIAYIKFKIFGKKIKIPFPLPINLRWSRYDNYTMKSYKDVDYSDIYGAPKSILQYQEGSDNQLLAKQYYEYYKPDETIPTYKNGFEASNIVANNRPGMVEQAWGETYSTKTAKIKFIPWLMHFGANTQRTFVYTNMQYKYVPPIIKETTTNVDGLEVKSTNTGFDYYTGTPVEVRSTDSYKQTKIKRVVPAYWKYSEMGPATAVNNETYHNNLTAVTGEYLYLNQVDNNSLLSANITTWSKAATGPNSTGWRVADYLQPEKVIDANNYRYLYKKVAGDDIKAAYEKGATADVMISRSAIGVYRNYEQYTYDVNLNKNGTYASFTPFNYGPGGQSTLSWKKVLTNELYDANGTLLQSKDILSKYVTQHMGYNFSNAISVVANSSYAQSAYEGAENTYKNAADTTQVFLEADRFKLGDASVVKVGSRSPSPIDIIQSYDSLLNFTNLQKRQQIIAVTRPAIPITNTVVGRLAVTFNNGISRTLIIKVKDASTYQVTTDAGELFEGFLCEPQKNKSTDILIFDWDKIKVLNYIANNVNGYLSSYYNDVQMANSKCSGTLKYIIPGALPIMEAHTGIYVFCLDPGKTGTTVDLPVQDPQQVLKFKSLVWVYNTSPSQTALNLQLVDASNHVVKTASTTMATPYVKAGNWCLLRTDLAISSSELSTNCKVRASVSNGASSGTAIYDDFRVLPYDAEMSNKVFEHQFNRLTSTLDADNFATYYNYDARGRVTESKIEVQNIGKKVVKKMRYHDQVDVNAD